MPDLKQLLNTKPDALITTEEKKESGIYVPQPVSLIGRDLPTVKGRLLEDVDSRFLLSGLDAVNEIAARDQSAFDQWVNGAAKFVGKTGTAVLGATVGTADGILEALANWEFSKVYDNHVNNFLDGLNHSMDEAMPNLRTMAEQEMSIGRQLLTSNFWADEFLGGASFMAGAVLSAYLTGGIGTPSQLSRAGSVMKLLQKADTVTDAIKQAGNISQAGKALGALRTTLVGAGYESSIEALHTKNEIVKQLTDEYINKNGTDPDDETIKGFEKAAVDMANDVFAANLATVGFSNAVLFTKIFGQPLKNLIPAKLIGGKGLSKIGEELVDKSVTGWRKYLTASKRFILNPVTEAGEELAQGLYSSSALDYVMSKYSHDGADASYSIISALADNGLDQIKNMDKDSIKEGLIGGILGLIGLPGAGNFLQPFKDAASALRGESQYQNVIDRYNTLTSNTKENLKGFIRQQEINNSGNNSTLFDAKNSESLGLFNLLGSRYNAGYINDVVSDFESQIDSMTNQEFANMLGYDKLSPKEIKGRKAQALESLNKVVDEYKSSRETAKRLDTIGSEEIQEGLAYTIFGIKDADKRFDSILEDLRSKGIGVDNIKELMYRGNSISFRKTGLLTREDKIKSLESERDNFIKENKRKVAAYKAAITRLNKKNKSNKKVYSKFGMPKSEELFEDTPAVQKLKEYENTLKGLNSAISKAKSEYQKKKEELKTITEKQRSENPSSQLEKDLESYDSFKRELKHRKELHPEEIKDIEEQIDDLTRLALRRKNFIDEMEFLSKSKNQKGFDEAVNTLKDRINKEYERDVLKNKRNSEKYMTSIKQEISDIEKALATSKNARTKKRLGNRLNTLNKQYQEYKDIELNSSELKTFKDTISSFNGNFTSKLFKNMYDIIAMGKDMSNIPIEDDIGDLEKEELLEFLNSDKTKKTTSESNENQQAVFSNGNEFFIIYQSHLLNKNTGELNEEVKQAMVAYENGAQATLQFTPVESESVPSNSNRDVTIQRGIFVNGQQYFVNVVVNGIDIGGLMNPNRYSFYNDKGQLVSYDLNNPVHFKKLNSTIQVGSSEHKKFLHKYNALKHFWKNVIEYNINEENMSIPFVAGALKGKTDGIEYTPVLNVYSLSNTKEQRPVKEIVEEWGIEHQGKKTVLLVWGKNHYILQDGTWRAYDSKTDSDLLQRYYSANKANTNNRIGEKGGKGILVNIQESDKIFPVTFPEIDSEENAEVTNWIKENVGNKDKEANVFEFDGRITLGITKDGNNRFVQKSYADLVHTSTGTALVLQSPAFGEVTTDNGTFPKKLYLNILKNKSTGEYFFQYKNGETYATATIGKEPSVKNIIEALNKKLSADSNTIVDTIRSDYNLDGLNINFKSENIENVATNISTDYSGSFSVIIKENGEVKPQTSGTHVNQLDFSTPATSKFNFGTEKEDSGLDNPEDVVDLPEDAFADASSFNFGDISFNVSTETKEEVEEVEEDEVITSPKDVDLDFSIKPTEAANSTIEKETKRIQRLLGNVSVKDIEEVLHNISNRGITMGAFSNGIIYLAEKLPKGTGMHEAFHYVFRGFLSQEELESIYETASKKYGKPNSETLADFRAMSSTRNKMSELELERLWYEEKMADEFAEYDNKNIFAKIFDKIKYLVKKWFGVIDDIELLFLNIHQGNYRNKATDKFTSEVAFSLKGVNLRKQKKGDNYVYVPINVPLSSRDSKMLASMIFQQMNKGYTFKSAVKYVENRFDLKKWNNVLEVLKKEGDAGKIENFIDRIISIRTAIAEKTVIPVQGKEKLYNSYYVQDNLDELRKMVQSYEAVFTKNQSEQDDDILEDERDETTELFSRGSDRGLGFTSLGRIFRQYLGSIHGEMDYFELGIELSGEQHVFPVDSDTLYNALLAFSRNLPEDKIFTNLQMQSKDNTTVKMFFDRWVKDISNDLNIDNVDELTHAQLKESQWYTTVVKALTRVEEQYVDAVIMPPTKGTPYSKIQFFNSNQTDTEQIQKSNWYLKAKLIKNLDAETIWKTIEEDWNTLNLSSINTETKLEAKVNEYKSMIEATGVTLSPGYLRYSILNKFKQEVVQSEGFEEYKRILKTFDHVEYPLDTDIIYQIRKSYGDISSVKKHHSTVLIDKDKGASGRFLNIAKSNAYFDETVRKTTIKNSNGENIYPIKLPSFDAELVNQWKREGFEFVDNPTFENLQKIFPEYDEFLLKDYYDSIKRNFIVKNKSILERFKLWNLFGIRNEQIEGEDKQKLYGDSAEYSEMDQSGKMFVKLALYILSPQSVRKGDYRLFVPAVLEAKNTSKAVELPIGNYTEGSKLSGSGVAMIRERVLAERERIERVQRQLSDWVNFGIEIPMLVKGYHYNEVSGKKVFRINEEYYQISEDNKKVNKISEDDLGGKFKEIKGLLPFEFKDISLTPSDQDIQNWFKEKFNKFVEYISSEEIGVIKNTKEGYKNRLLPFIKPERKGNKEIPNRTNLVNEKGDVLMENVFEFFTSDYINSLHFMNLLYGNIAMQHKNEVDVVKRNGGLIGSGESLGSARVAYIESQVRNLNDENGLLAKNNPDTFQDVQDAQSYTSFAWFTKYLKEGGRLPKNNDLAKRIEKIINKLRAGVPLSKSDFKVMQKQTLTAIDKKPVIRDLFNYIKTSAHTQLRETYSYYTVSDSEILKIWSRYDKGEIPIEEVHSYYNAYPGYEYHHSMLNMMEREGIEMLSVTSSGKNALINVGKWNGSGFDVDPFEVGTVREQVKMESVKTKIIHGTQMMGLIDAEQSDDVITTLDDKQIKVSDIAKAYRKQLGKRTELGTKFKRKGLYKNGRINYEKLGQEFDSSINSSAPDPMLTEMAKVENGQPVYSWNMSVVSKKLQQIFHKYISSQTLKFKVAGTKYTLVSDYGFKVMIDSNDNVIPKKLWDKKTQYRTRDLKFAKKQNGIYYSEAIVPQWLLDQYDIKLGEEIKDPMLLFQLGIRIPTQDKHSMVVLKIVDTLPSMNETSIVLPSEIVFLSGADFDIDSLFSRFFATVKGKRYGQYNSVEEAYNEYLYSVLKEDKDAMEQIKLLADLINLETEEDANIDVKNTNIERILKNKGYSYAEFLQEHGQQVTDNIQYRNTGQYENITPITIQEADNLLLELEMHLVMNEGNKNISATKASLDLFQHDETGAIKYFQDLGLLSASEASGIYDALSKNEAQKNNDVGKAGIGPVALFNILYQKLYRSGTEFPIFGRTGFRLTNEDGERINNVISTVLSAMTDNAKERIAAKFNLSTNTLGTFMTLVSSGMSFKQALLIVNQPVIKELEKNLVASSRSIKTTNEEKEERRGANNFETAMFRTIDSMELPEVPEDYTVNDFQKALEEGAQNKGGKLFQAYIMQEYYNAHEISEDFRKASKIVSLVKGLKPTIGENFDFTKTLNDLGVEINITPVLQEVSDFEIQKDGISVLFKKGDQNFKAELIFEPNIWFDKIIETDEHLAAEILAYAVLSEDVGEVFFRQTSKFQNLISAIRNNVGKYITRKEADKLEDYFVSYLNILAYKQKTGKSFDYSFLTDKTKDGEYLLHKAIEGLKQSKEYGNSVLIKMLTELSSKNFDVAKMGIDTMSEQSPEFKQALLNEYAKMLDPNIETIQDMKAHINAGNKVSTKEWAKWLATKMFEYSFIMDNMMFRHNSLVKSLDPIVWKKFAQSMKEIEESFKGNKTFNKSTGKTELELIQEFAELYLRNPARYDNRVFAYVSSIRNKNRIVNGRAIGQDWFEYDMMNNKITLNFSDQGKFDKDYVKAIKNDANRFGLRNNGNVPLVVNFKSGYDSPTTIMRLETANIYDSASKKTQQYRRIDGNKFQIFELASDNKWIDTGKVSTTIPTNGYKFTYTQVKQLLSYDFVGFAQSISEAEELTDKIQMEDATPSGFNFDNTTSGDSNTSTFNFGETDQAGKKDISIEKSVITNNKRFYTGNIKPDKNTIFVFGSNPEGRHGAGAAKIAKDQFGAIYGQGEGLQGNSYALPTKDLRVKENKGFKSISKEEIIKNIQKLYSIALENPNKLFKVAYRNTNETSLNGYTGFEMIEMFNEAGTIPDNIIFSKEWFDTNLLNISEENFEQDEIPPCTNVSDLKWD